MSNSRIELLNSALDENPENAFARFALAREYQKLKNREEARKAFEFLVEQTPEYGGTYYHYILLLWELEDYDRAQEILDKGIIVLQQNKELHLLNELMSLRDQWPV